MVLENLETKNETRFYSPKSCTNPIHNESKTLMEKLNSQKHTEKIHWETVEVVDIIKEFLERISSSEDNDK